MSNESSKEPESTRTQSVGKEDPQSAKQATPASTSAWNQSRGDSVAKQPGAKGAETQKPGQHKAGQPTAGKGVNAEDSAPRTGAKRDEGNRHSTSDPKVEPVKSGAAGRSEADRAKPSGDQPARPTQK